MPRILIILFLSISLAGTAQNEDIGDLLLALKNSKEDTSRINILHDIQAAYLDVDNDSALFYNKQAEVLIDKLQAESLRHRCYHAFVKIYHAKFDNAMAVDYCLKGIAVAEKFKDDFQKGFVVLWLGF